jgi:uncharacterized membrane protein SpoIIM required for sporulation
MKQDLFIERHAAEWQALERWLDAQERPRRAGTPRRRLPPLPGEVSEGSFPAAYRRLCQQLALANARGYSPVVVQRLRTLMERGHRLLYRAPAPRWRKALDFLMAGFPRLVRANGRFMWAAAALFYLPLLGMLVALQLHPELVHSLVGPMEIASWEEMYNPAAEHIGRGRDSGGDWQMFGLYIFNNISIGLRTFASGLVFCVGAIYVLLANGVIIGTVFGHLQAIGFGGPLWRFTCGHGAFELNAIVICGGAGLRMGMAIIAPGRLSRGRALVDAGSDGARLAMGALVMLTIAAFIEAFWSSIGWLPGSVKYSVAGVLWTAVLLWLWRGGRGLGDAD